MGVAILGIDPGKLHDPTAVVAVEEVLREKPVLMPNGQPLPRDAFNEAIGLQDPPALETHYEVRALERMPLGTGYPEVARRIATLARRLYDRDPSGEQYALLDVTGLGRPVLDMVREAMIPQVHVVGVTLTGTDKAQPSARFRNEVSVGKLFLVRRLQVLLQARRLHIPGTRPMAAPLLAELRDYQFSTSASGNDTFDAKAGAHDDLVIALGLAVLDDTLRDVRYQTPLYATY